MEFRVDLLATALLEIHKRLLIPWISVVHVPLFEREDRFPAEIVALYQLGLSLDDLLVELLVELDRVLKDQLGPLHVPLVICAHCHLHLDLVEDMRGL